MAKRKIQDLLGDELQDSVSSVTLDKQIHGKPEQSSSLPVTERQTTKLQDSVSSELPKYQTLERKEVRFSADHLDALTSLTRRLNRTRRGRGERITDNTLIRVAVAVLIDYSDRIEGTTEEEILLSFRELLGRENS
ncbi:MAG TPA: hypothetical protein V6C65_26920 [Allocoleopsis sp.]